VAGSFVHPNVMGIYAAAVLPLALAVAPHLARRWSITAYACAGACTLMLGLSLARVAWVVAAVAVLVVGLVQARRMLVGAIVVAVLAVALVPAIGNRIDDLRANPENLGDGDRNSWAFRTRYWGEILPRWEEDRVLGIGLGTVEATEAERLEPHNLYVQVLVEMGALGVAALGLVFVAAAVDLRRSWRRTPPGRSLQRGLVAAGTGVALGLAVGGISENLLTSGVTHLYAAVVLVGALVPAAARALPVGVVRHPASGVAGASSASSVPPAPPRGALTH
jgi:putative inorganic carbon (hco3(-)) transporter